MRILLVCSWYPSAERPFDGSFFAEQARMLAGSGLRVGVLALRQVRAEDPAWLAPPRAASEDGIVVVRASAPALPPGARRLEPAVHARVARRAARLVEDAFGVPDALHAHTVFPGATVARGLARLWGRPYAITEHRPSTLDSPAFVARCRPIAAAVAGAGALTTVSDGFARRLGEHYGTGEWEAVPLPVPALFFDEPLGGADSAGSADGTGSAGGAGSADGTGGADSAGGAGGATAAGVVRFVHVSHLDGNKRPGPMCDAFLEAFPHGGARLDVVGGSPAQVGALRSAVGDRPGAASIRFHGRMDRRGTAREMARADVFVLASAVEAGGTVLSEAQAAGCRLVATSTWAGEHAVSEGTGLLVPVDDPGALARAMRRAADPTAFAPADRIRERARARYGEGAFVRRWRRIYASLAEGGRGGGGRG